MMKYIPDWQFVKYDGYMQSLFGLVIYVRYPMISTCASKIGTVLGSIYQILYTNWFKLKNTIQFVKMKMCIPSVINIKDQLLLFSVDAFVLCLMWVLIDSTGDVVIAS